jgi:hypothetical protein
MAYCDVCQKITEAVTLIFRVAEDDVRWETRCTVCDSLIDED